MLARRMSVRLSQEGRAYCIETDKLIELVFSNNVTFGLSCIVGYWNGIWASPKMKMIAFGTLPRTLDLKKIRYGTSSVAGVVSGSRTTTVARLPPWASTFVYNTMGVGQRVARVHRQCWDSYSSHRICLGSRKSLKMSASVSLNESVPPRQTGNKFA